MQLESNSVPVYVRIFDWLASGSSQPPFEARDVFELSAARCKSVGDFEGVVKSQLALYDLFARIGESSAADVCRTKAQHIAASELGAGFPTTLREDVRRLFSVPAEAHLLTMAEAETAYLAAVATSGERSIDTAMSLCFMGTAAQNSGNLLML